MIVRTTAQRPEIFALVFLDRSVVDAGYAQTHQTILGDRVLNLQKEHVDLAVRIGELPDSSLIATRVGLIRNVVCASPAYFAKHGTPQKPYDLAKHDCVTFAGMMSPDAWTFKTGRSEILVPIHSRLAVNTAEAAVDAVIAGAGLTRVLSYQIEEAVKTGVLAIALKKFEPTPAPINLVYTGQRLLPLKLRALLDFAAPRLRARLPGMAALQTRSF